MLSGRVMTIPLDTTTALSPARSVVVVEARDGSGKAWLLVPPFGMPARQPGRDNQLIDKE